MRLRAGFGVFHARSGTDERPQAFTTIALLMGVCIMWDIMFSIFFNKKYLSRLKTPKKDGAAGGGLHPRLW